MAPGLTRPARPRLAWLVGAVAVGVVALVGQVFWLFFEQGVRAPALRPAYALACAVFRCELPPLRALAAWSAGAVELAWHPDGQRLALRTTITNAAGYAQPLPLLVARFSGIDGGIVAEQTFPPAAYLRGAAPRSLPSGGRLDVAVVADDPGVAAVNCDVSFAWP